MAATFVNADARHIWKPTVGGLVLSPKVRLNCAFATDGNSMHKSRSCIGLGGSGANASTGGAGACLPGCGPPSELCETLWQSSDPASANTVCHFGGKFGFHLKALNLQKELMALQPAGAAEAEEDDEEAQAALHNEMVVNGDSLIAQLPKAIEAVYFVATSSERERNAARAVHQALLKEYGIFEGDPGAPPLLLLDLVGAGASPFSVPSNAWFE